MNTKYAVALLLVMQVSVSLCDVPKPSPELLAKYEDLKTRITNRINSGFMTIKTNAEPVLGVVMTPEDVENVKESVASLPKAQQVSRTYDAVETEIKNLAAKFRNILLGIYQEYLRPKVGEDLSTAIDRLRTLVEIVDPPQDE
ncbi:apolipoprotein A-II [Brachionichthys hirsutus]|uniref:apolipoprotein A-II n=1 Tax=Brachionichthys hirsutus TaxID=412623 RepID=UPI003604A29A